MYISFFFIQGCFGSVEDGNFGIPQGAAMGHVFCAVKRNVKHVTGTKKNGTPLKFWCLKYPGLFFFVFFL